MKSREQLIGVAECRDRDQELVSLVGRHGAMTIEQLQRAMGAGRTVTYRRAQKLEAARLIERLTMPGVGAVLRATREGLAYARLPLPVAALGAGTIEHTLSCVEVAIRAGRHYGHGAILTEREIVAAEAIAERTVAAARVGSHRGQPRMHRADLAVLREEGTIAIEVELTPKAPKRLHHIVRSWLHAAHDGGPVAEVHYVCAPGQTHRAVERAVAKAGAGSHISVAEMPPL